MLPKKEEIRDKVVLVGLNSPVLREDSATEESMDELSALVETAGGETAGIVLQNRPTPDPRTFIGEGKVAEVQLYVENVGATMVIFDNDLSPSQQRVLTELLGIQVLDRCGLILDIFAQRAKTKEGRLQVELAQYRYLLPRLIGMWSHLERQGGTSGKGPIGSKGPGETQLETDRRHIRRRNSCRLRGKSFRCAKRFFPIGMRPLGNLRTGCSRKRRRLRRRFSIGRRSG